MNRLGSSEFAEEIMESELPEFINADVIELSVLAQLMGYKLESFQTLSYLQNLKEEVKIEITCLKSGVRSVLYKPNATCSCPSDDVLEKSQFWNVVGVGPSASHSSQTSISTFTSSLLPKISDTVAIIIKELLRRAFALINGADAVKDKVPATPEPLFPRHNSLNSTYRKEGVKRLKRTNSFDDTSNHISAPQTSTPDAVQLNANRFDCTKCNILTKYLININKIACKSLQAVPIKEVSKPFTTKRIISPRISNIKPTEGPSVKYLRETNGVKSAVRKETPKFLTTVRRCDTRTVNGENPYRTTPLNSATKTFATKLIISPRISDIKPTEGPSVKYLRETHGVKSAVRKETPKFPTTVRRCDTRTVNGENPYRTTPLNSATKKFTTKLIISPNISDIKPTEGPSVKYLRKTNGVKKGG